MFTEDYLMRIINMAIAALMTAVGLRKAGKYPEALQAVQQAIEQVTTLPANLVDQMEDGNILSLLVAQGQLDVGRLAILAELYQEQGEILYRLDQSVQARLAFAHALRFLLEVVLSDEINLSAENIGRVEGLRNRLKGEVLPFETRLALSDYYQRLLGKDDQSLATAAILRAQIIRELAGLQEQLK